MRIPLICANWKMHKTLGETAAFVREFLALAKHVRGVEIVLAPPFTSLATAAEIAQPTVIEIAGQDLYFERDGAFTGEVSAVMLADAGATHVIIGHSERRRLFAETDEAINRKTRAAHTAGLIPIVCVGETLEEREHGSTMLVLDRQVERALDGLSADELAITVVAYEPVWAIGTGKNATAEEADAAHRHIRSRLRQWFGGTPSDQCRVIYGGSVKPDNIAELIGLPDVDGALVGGASLDVRTFFDIVSRCAPAPRRG